MTNYSKISAYRDSIISTISPLINRNYLLLDVPNHPNLGDSLIWQGELDFFSMVNKFQLTYQYNMYTFSKKLFKNDDQILFLHGGGNFGDLYRANQLFRLDIIKSFPENRIIMFPQTLYYKNHKLIEYDFKILNSHKDLHLIFRDLESFELAKQYFSSDKLYLLPDMAFCLDFNDKINLTKSRKSLLMKRTDKELLSFDYESFIHSQNDLNNWEIRDWPSYSNNKILNYAQGKIESLERYSSLLIKDIPFINKIIDNSYGFKNKNGLRRNVDLGLTFLNKYDTIITTRLHGLILGVLLDKKVLILDNKYSKCTNFYNTWLKDFQNIKLLNDTNDI